MTIYLGMAQAGEKMSATMGYIEQTAAKMQMAALEVMNPLSDDYLEKLGHLQGAVEHHMHEEESKRFVELAEGIDDAERERLTRRYREEFERYMDGAGQGRGDSDPALAGQRETTGRLPLEEPRNFV